MVQLTQSAKIECTLNVLNKGSIFHDIEKCNIWNKLGYQLWHKSFILSIDYEIKFWFIGTQKKSKIKMEMYHHYKNGKPRDFLFYFWRFIGCDFTLHFVCDGSRQVFKGRDIKCSQGNKVRTQIKCSHFVRNWFLLLFNKNVKYGITCAGIFLNMISLISHSVIIQQQ